jgi:hypothetical protein
MTARLLLHGRIVSAAMMRVRTVAVIRRNCRIERQLLAAMRPYPAPDGMLRRAATLWTAAPTVRMGGVSAGRADRTLARRLHRGMDLARRLLPAAPEAAMDTSGRSVPRWACATIEGSDGSMILTAAPPTCGRCPAGAAALDAPGAGGARVFAIFDE